MPKPDCASLAFRTMKSLACAAAALAAITLPGCSTNTQLTESGQGIYSVVSEAGRFGSDAVARAKAIEAWENKCQSLNQRFNISNITTNYHDASTGAKAYLTFQCLRSRTG